MRKKIFKPTVFTRVMLIIGRTLREVFKITEVVVYIDDESTGIATRYKIIKVTS